MKFQILTLFPERYTAYKESGLPARAHKKGLFEINTVNLRDFADPGRGDRIDDTPYGGGPGMVLEVSPIYRALNQLTEKFPVVLFTPRGKKLNQKMVRSFSGRTGFTLISGYYEGVDERVAEHLVDYEISLGDFILGSGDLPALCFIESVTRLIPGYMGSPESHIEESNENELLEYPQYTKPAEFNGWKVPDVLLSGNHKLIREWRMTKSREITELRMNENEF
ncbi:MAG: tRNA (guanosine(37)-N1)-methyltransferase TrmD [Spirochaetia bacterium]|nr:tRNA (guanosine(37)-N1)-methyltransferase TrmD [Spirochaetia bacterium]